MNKLYSYQKERICGRRVIVFGFGESAQEFAVRLMAEGIPVAHFLYYGGTELDDENRPYIFNKSVISIRECLFMDQIVIAAPFQSRVKAAEILESSGLLQVYCQLERINPVIQNASVIVCYGTGGTAAAFGQRLLHYGTGLDIDYYCDTDITMRGKKFHGKPVIHLSDLKDLPETAAVVISSLYTQEIYQSVAASGFDRNRIFADLESFYLALGSGNVQQKYMTDHTGIASLMKDTRNRKMTVYGWQGYMEEFRFLTEAAGLECGAVYARESESEDGSLYRLSGICSQDDVLVILDRMTPEQKKMLDAMGLEEWQYTYLHNASSFHGVSYSMEYKVCIDASLGHTFRNQADMTHFSNFTVSEYMPEQEDAVTIVIAGGSTSAAFGVRNKPWSVYLSEILKQHAVAHKMICLGVHCYNASNELIQIIRDVLGAEGADIIINYSGVNNMLVADDSYLFYNSYQKELFQSFPEDVAYGERNCNTTRFEYWYKQMRMIHAICGCFGITHRAFLQPVLYSRRTCSLSDRNVAALDGLLWNTSEKCFESCGDTLESVCRYLDAAVDFRNKINTVHDNWLTDLSDIFDQNEDVYIDSCHVVNRGNEIIAQRIYDSLRSEGKIGGA